jgi:hypothetical protein
MVDRYGFTGAYESVKRYVRKLRGTQQPEARAIIQTAPGEERSPAFWSGKEMGFWTGLRPDPVKPPLAETVAPG